MNALTKLCTEGKLSLGLVFPIESYAGSIASMTGQEERAQRAEEVGFKALWFRDVPFNDPNFGDAGQLYDPWVYMAHIMNHTKDIALATGSAIINLRHPVHTAKSFLSLQQLSGGRVILGLASGDRALEYPAFGRNLLDKSELFRDSFSYIKALQGDFPKHESAFFGELDGGLDLLPKFEHHTPMLVTGFSGQELEWIAQHGDGWLYYPRDFAFLRRTLQMWNAALDAANQPWKPYMQSLYIDLLEEPSAAPQGIHLGFKSGYRYAIDHLKALEQEGVNHVIINLKYGSRPAAEVIEEFGEHILPAFT